MTSPDAGFGVNRVDLRGILAPAAAIAATAAVGVGRNSTAVPPERAASVTASFTLWAYPTVSAVSGSSHTRSTNPRCNTVTSRSVNSVGSSSIRRSGGQCRIQIVHDRACSTVGQHGREPDVVIQLSQSGLGAVYGRDAGDPLYPREGVPKGQSDEYPVNRVHLGPISRGVDEERQAAIPWAWSGRRPQLTLEFAIGGVPVVAVCDEGMTRHKIVIDGRMHALICDAPQAMPGFVGRYCGREQVRFGDACDNLRRSAAAVVHEIDRLEIRTRRPHQRESVSHWASHGVLMREDDAIRGVAQLQCSEQPASCHAAGGPHLVHVQASGPDRRDTGPWTPNDPTGPRLGYTDRLTRSPTPGSARRLEAG